MELQLTLIEAPDDWKLDDRTRNTGRRGVAQARDALRDAVRSLTESSLGAAPPDPIPGRRAGARSPGLLARCALFTARSAA